MEKHFVAHTATFIMHITGEDDLKKKQKMINIALKDTPEIKLGSRDTLNINFGSTIFLEESKYLENCLSALEYAEKNNLRYTLTAKQNEWDEYKKLLKKVSIRLKKLDNAFEKAVLEKL